MTEDVVIVPEEDRLLPVGEEPRDIEVPGEWRIVFVLEDTFGQ